MLDMCQDIWLYISQNYFLLKLNENEVGSSTMPHKINPINFENAEGNFMLANNLLQFFSRKLPISRLQRDLTDSTILRNVGVAFSYTLIGLKSLEEGLQKLEVNQQKLESDLQDNFSVVAEGIQTRLKVLGVENSYETFKELTRNHDGTKMNEKIASLVNSLDIEETEKKYMNTITPLNYTGIYKL
jgi:adenylosuccinate lyase